MKRHLIIAPTKVQLEAAKLRHLPLVENAEFFPRVVGTQGQFAALMSEPSLQVTDIHGLDGYPPGWVKCIHALHKVSEE